MGNHTKRTPEFLAEIETLIKLHLNTQWSGDREGAGVTRLIEILRKNTTDSPCIVKASENEAIFVLRAKDRLAPDTIRYWAKGAKRHGLRKPRFDDAVECAAEMDKFKGKKYPD